MDVIVSAKGARYHVNESCPGRLQGIDNSENLDRQVHPIERVDVDEAKRRGKLPCKRCVSGT